MAHRSIRKPVSQDRTYWLNIAKGSIAWRAGDEDLLDRVADRCVEEQLAGRNCGVWHCLSLVTGNKCMCAQCMPNVKKLYG